MSWLTSIPRSVLGIAACGLLSVSSGLVAEEKSYREWKGSDGRTLEARIIWVDGEVVRMERVDGEVFDIPVSRFGEEDRREILAWKPPPIEIPAADDAVLVIETPDGRGSGFLVQEHGRVWVYTNQHVIGDSVGVRALDTSGNEIELGRLEIASDRDLARFETPVRKGLPLAGSSQTGAKVLVFGNSQGTGVITRSEGEVLGISSNAVEVSSEIVSGNSGGPVVNEEGEVIGISSYVKFGEFSADPTVKDTRYEKPRRFALRLDQEIDFRRVSRADFRDQYEVFNEQIAVFDESLDLTQEITSDPSSRVMSGNFDSPEIKKIAEDHNKDVAKIPRLVSSGLPYRSQVRKFSGRLIDTLEDAYAVGASSLSSAKFVVRDERFGWMISELDRREQLLERWREMLVRVEESFD